MNDEDAQRLLECAKWFHHHAPPEAQQPIPSTFADGTEALACMRDALLFEAHQSLQEGLKVVPERLISNPMDLESDQPGIAVVTPGGQVVTRRSDAIIRPITYPIGALEDDTTTRDESVAPPVLSQAKRKQALLAAEKAATRAHDRAERRAAETFMTREERKERAAERREERERKRQEKAEAAAAKETPDDGKADEADEADGAEEPKAPTEAHRAFAAHDAVESAHSIPPLGETPPAKKPRKTADEAAPEYFASPAPHDRYLQALGDCALHPNLAGTVLRGEPAENPHLQIVHGPPGTGKTHSLLDALEGFHEAFPHARCFICGPSNLAAASLYTRAFARGLVGCLSLSKENMPPGVPRPRAMDLRTAKFVFSTIAGRSGPRLRDERFTAAFCDEAGLCPESIVFGLLRPEMSHLYMVGDLNQLGAITSEPGVGLHHQRSMMERLVSLGVASTTLTVQRRMHPEICEYPSKAFYEGRLVTHEDCVGAPSTLPLPYGFVDLRGEARSVGTSVENVAEAQRAVAIAKELLSAFPRTVLLTPYAAQLKRLRAAQSGIEAHTVDSFQGKESDAVVLSLVRTPAMGPGFWADARRLVVALTRSKHALRIVGHGGWVDEAGPLADLLRDATDRGVVGS